MKDADPRASFLPDARAETGCASFIEAIKFDGEARFHARKFVLGLMEHLTANYSVRAYEESGAVGYAFGPDGVMIKTEKGEVRAKRMVSATGMPSAALKDVQALLVPRVSYVVAGTLESPAMTDANYWDTEEPYNYFRYVGGKTIVLGGADRDGDKTIDLKEAESILKGVLTKLGMTARVDRVWSGGLYFTADGLPYADAVPGKDGRAFVATGFGGNGMVMGSLSGMIAGSLAAGVPHPHADVFRFARTGADKKMGSAEARGLPAWRWLLPLFYLAVLVVPGWIFFSARGGFGLLEGADAKTARLLTFPLLGLYAFTLIWAQIMIGSQMPRLRHLFPRIETFHRAQGVFALVFALAHPTFLITALGFSEYLKLGFVDPSNKAFVLLGDVQLLVLMTTVATALLMKMKWLQTRWHLIHLANYAVFAMVWTHSWFLGSDVRFTPLKWLWFFYAATYASAIVMRILRTRRKLPDAATGKWFAAAGLSELEEGKAFCAIVEGREIALIRSGEKIHALDNICTHAGGPLCKGTLKGNEIECPWHQSRFSIETGAPTNGPAVRPQPRFETRVKGGKVEVKL
jgi:nitrite reductase/ring-hydroxylating ferredoxin subunit/DMSO/TMAO reductase YedYZ heme-binding membrane subunit